MREGQRITYFEFINYSVYDQGLFARRYPKTVPIKLTDLIARVPSEVETKVRRVRERARPALQQALRSECRVLLRTAEESQQSRSGKNYAEVSPSVRPWPKRSNQFAANRHPRNFG